MRIKFKNELSNFDFFAHGAGEDQSNTKKQKKNFVTQKPNRTKQHHFGILNNLSLTIIALLNNNIIKTKQLNYGLDL
ncbi:hypothetical protein SCALIN_C13_0122 [Candidatus Scalindua japonica]|uniref:Uncharacterized protein n=1 Tax=Candidatus Scalindua japonica TaxID=1284222 RepID=A0A286TXH8_9BACT|nr:hypothetical protein SCALIN_C13_0122 [Candidatus Scalindua japonica]